MTTDNPTQAGTLDGMLDYAKRHLPSIALMGVMLVLTYYYRLLTTSVSMDSTIAVIDTDYVYRWQAILERNGLLLINWVFGTVQLIPGYANVLLMLATFVYGVIWMALLGKVRADKGGVSFDWVFPVLYFSSVPMLEVVCYQHQGFQIAVGVGLIGYALYLWWDHIESRSWPKLACAVVMSGIAFSTYQSLIMFMVSAIVGTHLAFCRTRGKSLKEALVIALRSILLVGLSYVVFKLVNLAGTMLVRPQSDSSYLTGQIMWGKFDVADIVGGLVSHIKLVCLGRGLYSKWFSLGAGLALVTTVLQALSMRKSEGKGLYLVLVLAVLLASPFFLSIASGSGTVAMRAELSLACTYALLATIAFNDVVELMGQLLQGREELVCSCVRGLCALSCVLVIALGVTPANRLLYTDYRVLQEQYLLTVGLHEQYERIDAGRGLTPVFVGQWHPHYDASMAKGELLGTSLYEWGNRASTEYWQALGYEVTRASDEQLRRAYELAADMPRLPMEGSVQEREGMVIFALPDPEEPM